MIAEREKLLKPYLPAPPSSTPSPGRAAPKQRRKPVRGFVKTSLYVLIFNVIHFIFSIYIRLRRAYHAVQDRIISILYYHHRTPELIKRDVKKLPKLPKHLSVVLELDDGGINSAGLEGLVTDVCEIAAWTASAGITQLSIYERTGVLKASLPHLHRRISRTMSSYFGTDSGSKPTISIRAPHMQSYSPETSPSGHGDSSPPHLNILLISAVDGRRTLVDLTKTLAEMSQKGKLATEDINAELIDAEISESVMGEPDLLMLFGDAVVLQGYPPWQVRLTEIL
ncbi:hypothetical protein M8818_002578 [Zalaria obscura]|uniref:Uncharacterized protein n=1 Tax=Zalaria obscura TaxID=2024903 RepID=A0ACC3SGX0_9PEZI